MGYFCRYDGERREITPFVEKFLCPENEILTICPEFIIFKKAPRDKIMFSEDGNAIVKESGDVVTSFFHEPVERMILTVKKFDPDIVILKEKSPSCALSKIYKKGKGFEKGQGIFANRLKEEIDTQFFNEFGDKF